MRSRNSARVSSRDRKMRVAINDIEYTLSSSRDWPCQRGRENSRRPQAQLTLPEDKRRQSSRPSGAYGGVTRRRYSPGNSVIHHRDLSLCARVVLSSAIIIVRTKGGLSFPRNGRRSRNEDPKRERDSRAVSRRDATRRTRDARQRRAKTSGCRQGGREAVKAGG